MRRWSRALGTFTHGFVAAAAGRLRVAGAGDAGAPTWEEPRMRTKEMASLDMRWTWKPYMIAYEIIVALRGQETGSVVEVTTKDDPGVLQDLRTWCEATGNELVGSLPQAEGEVRSLIRKGKPRRYGKSMTVVISTASLEHVVYPLDKALAAAVLGMDVNLVFEGAGVRLLRQGYRSRLSGAVGRVFTAMVERVMSADIGWPLPQEAVRILADLGARFYICGPSMSGYAVAENELVVPRYTVAAVVTWADLLAHTDIPIFSKAQFEKP
jgi:predicted peroxiredoxin/TusA-related sulfurtransferase